MSSKPQELFEDYIMLMVNYWTEIWIFRTQKNECVASALLHQQQPTTSMFLTFFHLGILSVTATFLNSLVSPLHNKVGIDFDSELSVINFEDLEIVETNLDLRGRLPWTRPSIIVGNWTTFWLNVRKWSCSLGTIVAPWIEKLSFQKIF